MASLRTAGCDHRYMRDAPGEPCIFCGAPRAETQVETLRRESARAMRAADFLAVLAGGRDNAARPYIDGIENYAESLDRRAEYLTGRDPGDEE